jgi:hypothetical protein
MGRKLSKSLKHILDETKNEFSGIYAGRLKEMILFGSCARGENSSESDIDIALILDDVMDVTGEYDLMLPAISRISLKYDTVLSVVPLGYKDFQHKKTPLILNILNEGIRII